ncbi:1-deoxy-D-xylulose-5-phosphate synthase [Dirofilaria immitis]
MTVCIVDSQYYYFPYPFYYLSYYNGLYYYLYPQFFPQQYYIQLPFGAVQTTTSSTISFKLPYPYSLANIKVEGLGFSPAVLVGAAAGALLGFLAGK